MLFHITATLLTIIFARGGGGGHGGGGHSGGSYGGGGYGGAGGSGSSSWWEFIPVVIFILIYAYSAIQGRKNKSKAPKKSELQWPADFGADEVTKIFLAFQSDWSSFSLKSMQTYTTPQYYYSLSLMLSALDQMGRQNLMENVRLLSCYPINESDDSSVSQGMVVVVNGSAKDSLIDKLSGNVFYTDTSQFSEYWYFTKIDGAWKLSDITQVTESENVLHPAIQDFAQKNNFLYSGEWGSLLMPTRGELFSKANFARSAINDHVIGTYKNTIIEFYTYLPDKNYPESHTVAQVILPKSYGQIIVHRNSGILNMTPKGMTKVTLEWPDFNKKYSVFASDTEKVTSLELLNPLYMVKLEELPFVVNIEVVDNVVYLHTDQALPDYTPMMEILYLAFKEMRM